MNPTKKESKMSASVKVTRAAWRVMMLDKEVIGIGAISMLINIFVFMFYVAVAFFVLPMTVGHENGAMTLSGPVEEWKYYVLLAIYLMTAYFVTNFFGGAISHAAFRRFDGEDPTARQALVAAKSKTGAILKYTGLQVTVGLVLSIIADRVPFAGKIAVWLAGAAWGVASMFSIPVIMSSDETNPVKVVKKSAKTFVDIWAESVFIGISLGVISIISTIAMMVVVLGLFAASIALESVGLAILAAIFLFASFAGIALLTNTLQQIVMTAAYYYASTGCIPAGFDEELVRSMFRPKKKWLA
jgi:hypothetical protein